MVVELPVIPDDVQTTFIEEALWHGSLERADAILKQHPDLSTAGIHTASILGEEKSVRRFLSAAASNATLERAPYGGNPLVYLCLSKYLRRDKSRSEEFRRTAAALLDAGADPRSGFWTKGDFPEFESALYGAAGVAHDAQLTRLLLERGADPNDGEAVYHSPETYESEAMKLLVGTGRLTPENLSIMLVRKIDWHDYEGIDWLLQNGANAAFKRKRGWSPIHHSLARSNGVEIISLLLDHRADPTVIEDGMTSIARAAREGRGDVLRLFEERGIPSSLRGVDRLIAACAAGDEQSAHSMAAAEPTLVEGLKAMGGELMAKFSGNGNADGVRLLLDLGVDAAVPYSEGDVYFDEPKGSLPIHIAAWRSYPEIVRILVERGSPIDLPDAKGRTPLMLSIKALVDSYWSERCTPESARLLLERGASTSGIASPTGNAAVDALLREYGTNPMGSF